MRDFFMPHPPEGGVLILLIIILFEGMFCFLIGECAA